MMGSQSERIVEAWRKSLDDTRPSLDVEQGAERLLVSMRRPEARQPRFKWDAARFVAAVAVFAAVAAMLVWARPWITKPEPGAERTLKSRPGETHHIKLGQGSELSVHGTARVRVEEPRDGVSRVVVEDGAVEARIQPHHGSLWWFDVGPFRIRVIGTAFSTSYSVLTRQFSLEMHSGRVQVTGPLLEESPELAAGDRCVVDLGKGMVSVRRNLSASMREEQMKRNAAAGASGRSASAIALGAGDDVASGGGASRSADGSPELGSQAEQSPTAVWDRVHELEMAGKYAHAVQLVEARLGELLPSASGPDLLTLARAARYAGRLDVAGRALRQCRESYPQSAEAAMAAFLMGRDAPASQAAEWFERYLAEAPQGPWAREAAGRLLESHRTAGNHAAARRAAASYLAKYPEGPHAAFARQVVAAP